MQNNFKAKLLIFSIMLCNHFSLPSEQKLTALLRQQNKCEHTFKNGDTKLRELQELVAEKKRLLNLAKIEAYEREKELIIARLNELIPDNMEYRPDEIHLMILRKNMAKDILLKYLDDPYKYPLPKPIFEFDAPMKAIDNSLFFYDLCKKFSYEKGTEIKELCIRAESINFKLRHLKKWKKKLSPVIILYIKMSQHKLKCYPELNSPFYNHLKFLL